MVEFFLAFLAAIRVFFRSRGDTALEVLALRQQGAVLKRKRPRPRLNRLDRFFWTSLRQVWPRWAELLVIVKPETVVGWRHKGFRLFWTWTHRRPWPVQPQARVRGRHPPGRRPSHLVVPPSPYQTRLL